MAGGALADDPERRQTSDAGRLIPAGENDCPRQPLLPALKLAVGIQQPFEIAGKDVIGQPAVGQRRPVVLMSRHLVGHRERLLLNEEQDYGTNDHERKEVEKDRRERLVVGADDRASHGVR